MGFETDILFASFWSGALECFQGADSIPPLPLTWAINCQRAIQPLLAVIPSLVDFDPATDQHLLQRIPDITFPILFNAEHWGRCSHKAPMAKPRPISSTYFLERALGRSEALYPSPR